MNTNSNTYTVIYTTIVVVIVAAVLAVVSQKLGPMQAANEEAETISQILTAAQFGEKEHWQEIGNAKTIEFFRQNVEEQTKVYSTADLKALNYKIKDGSADAGDLPCYCFNNGVTVFPVYGAGLWGPVWGYIALAEDFRTVVGAYFDHASETPGLGGKIKDDPAFRAQFTGKKVIYDENGPLSIIKGGAPAGMENAVDAITGATMTSKGLNDAITTWLNAYKETVTETVAVLEQLEEMAETSNAEEE